MEIAPFSIHCMRPFYICFFKRKKIYIFFDGKNLDTHIFAKITHACYKCIETVQNSTQMCVKKITVVQPSRNEQQ